MHYISAETTCKHPQPDWVLQRESTPLTTASPQLSPARLDGMQYASQLQRQFEAQAATRLAALQRAATATATLLAAVHRSRALASSTLAPWRALAARSRAAAAAAAQLHARAMDAWQRASAQACAVAASRQQHHRRLQRIAIEALASHAAWAHSLLHLHSAHLKRSTLRRWRQAAAEGREVEWRAEAAAATHRSGSLCRTALASWRAGAAYLKKERIVGQRRERRWADVQRFLADHRAAKQQQQQRAPPPSSAENSSCWDPNTIFYEGG